jgi:hypothetical protein
VENRVVEVLVMGAVLFVVGRRAEDQVRAAKVVVEAKGVRVAKAKTAVKAAKCTMDSPHL